MSAFDPLRTLTLRCLSQWMRSAILVTAAILLINCSSPGERKQNALMDKIEEQVQLPEGARPLGDYARYYTYGKNGDVHGVYLIPFNDEPRPGESCEKLIANFTSRDVPCPPMQSPDALAVGKRQWLEDRRDLPFVNDGGCMEVDVVFDPSKARVKSVDCNGTA